VYLLGRRFVILVRDNPEGLTVPLVSLAGAIGLGQGTGRNSPLIRSLSRMVAFGLARVDPATGWPSAAAGHPSPRPAPAGCPAASRPTTTLPSKPPPTPPGPPTSKRSGDAMTADALDRLAARLCDAADYAAATGEPITAQVLRLAASAARQLAERERTEAA
jgi:hypothetical protein